MTANIDGCTMQITIGNCGVQMTEELLDRLCDLRQLSGYYKGGLGTVLDHLIMDAECGVNDSTRTTEDFIGDIALVQNLRRFFEAFESGVFTRDGTVLPM